MTKSNSNDRTTVLTAVFGLLGALLITAWLLGYFERDEMPSDDPQVVEFQRAMQLPEDEQDWALLKRKYAALTPAQQQEVARQKMLMYLPEQEEQLRSFFAQSEEEQWEQIDQEIDAGEEKRRRYQAQAAAKGQSGKQLSSGEVKAKGTDGMNPQGIMKLKQVWTAHASPELRSMMDRRIRMTNQRRKERGLPPL